MGSRSHASWSACTWRLLHIELRCTRAQVRSHSPRPALPGSHPVPSAAYSSLVLSLRACAAPLTAESNYQGLGRLYERYKDYGLQVLAFPCNQVWGRVGRGLLRGGWAGAWRRQGGRAAVDCGGSLASGAEQSRLWDVPRPLASPRDAWLGVDAFQKPGPQAPLGNSQGVRPW